MMYVKLIFVSCLIVFAAGCTHIYGDSGVIKNRDTDYLKAQSIPPLKIPAGFASNSMESLYPVSEKQFPASQMKVDLTPPELNSTSH